MEHMLVVHSERSNGNIEYSCRALQNFRFAFTRPQVRSMSSDKSESPADLANAAPGFAPISKFQKVAPAVRVSEVDARSYVQHLNPAAFAALLEGEVRRARRTKCELSLALFSFDGGRSDAAVVLGSITNCIRRNLRETDEFAILGDAEVAVLLLETSLEGGLTYGQRMLREVGLSGIAVQTSSYPSPAFNDLLTLHFGLASLAGAPRPSDPHKQP